MSTPERGPPRGNQAKSLTKQSCVPIKSVSEHQRQREASMPASMPAAETPMDDIEQTLREVSLNKSTARIDKWSLPYYARQTGKEKKHHALQRQVTSATKKLDHAKRLLNKHDAITRKTERREKERLVGIEENPGPKNKESGPKNEKLSTSATQDVEPYQHCINTGKFFAYGDVSTVNSKLFGAINFDGVHTKGGHKYRVAYCGSCSKLMYYKFDTKRYYHERPDNEEGNSAALGEDSPHQVDVSAPILTSALPIETTTASALGADGLPKIIVSEPIRKQVSSIVSDHSNSPNAPTAVVRCESVLLPSEIATSVAMDGASSSGDSAADHRRAKGKQKEEPQDGTNLGLTCAQCAKFCTVPFVPKNGRPVLCKECHSEKRGKESTGSSSRSHDDRDARSESQGGAVETITVCASCGESCTVPFVPKLGKPVYCKNCYKKNPESRGLVSSPGSKVIINIGTGSQPPPVPAAHAVDPDFVLRGRVLTEAENRKMLQDSLPASYRWLGRSLGNYFFNVKEVNCDHHDVAYTGEKRLISNRGVKEYKQPFEVRTVSTTFNVDSNAKTVTIVFAMLLVLTLNLVLSIVTQSCQAGTRVIMMTSFSTVSLGIVSAFIWYLYRWPDSINVSCSYVPHLLSNVLLEFERGSDPAAAAKSLRQKIRRLAAFPLPDCGADLYIESTEVAALVCLQSSTLSTSLHGRWIPYF